MFQEITAEQIAAWKKQYGEEAVLMLKFDKGKVYLLEPTKAKGFFLLAKRVLIAQQANDMLEAGQIVLNQCYLGGLGDLKEVNQDSAEYVSCCLNCTNLIGVMEASFTLA